MAGPITWRSITAPSDASGVSLLNQADQSFNNAFGAFDKAIGNVTQNRQKEYDHLVDTNTQAFMDEVAKYRTAEELQAARDAGVFDRMRTGFNGDVNSQQIRDLVPQAMQTLQQRTLTNNQYVDDTQGRKERSIWDDLNLRARNNDRAGIERILAEQTLVNEGEKSKGLYDILNGNETRNMQRTRFGWDASDRAREASMRERGNQTEELVASLASSYDKSSNTATQLVQQLRNSMPAGSTTAEVNAAVANLESRLQGRSTISSLDQGFEDKAVESLYREYNMDSNIYNGRDPKQINEQTDQVLEAFTQTDEDGNKQLLGIGDAQKRNKIQTAVRTYMTRGYELTGPDGKGTGQFIPLTPSMMSDALSGIKDTDWIDTVGDIDKVVKGYMEGNPQYIDQYVRWQDYENKAAQIRSGSFKALVNGKPQPQPVPKDVPVAAIDNAAAKVEPVQPVEEKQPAPVIQESVAPEVSENVPQRPAPRNFMERPVSGLVMDGFNAFMDGANNIRAQSEQTRIQNIERLASGDLKMNPTDMKRFLELGIPKEKIKPETLNQLRKILGEKYVNSLLE